MDMDGAILDPKVIYAAALTRRSHQIVLVQNYPGGKFDSYLLDIVTINQIVKAGNILDIPLKDYMVITPSGYYSWSNGENVEIKPNPPTPK